MQNLRGKGVQRLIREKQKFSSYFPEIREQNVNEIWEPPRNGSLTLGFSQPDLEAESSQTFRHSCSFLTEAAVDGSEGEERVLVYLLPSSFYIWHQSQKAYLCFCLNSSSSSSSCSETKCKTSITCILKFTTSFCSCMDKDYSICVILTLRLKCGNLQFNLDLAKCLRNT